MSSLNKSRRDNYIFIAVLSVIIIVCFITNYGGDIDNYNTTILALNYSYGLISRGFIGTVFLLCDKILPFSILNATGASLFLYGSTIVFFIIVLIFAYLVISKTKEETSRNMKCLLILLIISIATTFAHDSNLGRVDMYMITISLIGAILILIEKAEWLIVILSAAAVMIHQGYVLMYFNIPLVLLFYKFFSVDKKVSKVKYAVIFLLSLIAASVLFLYLELYAHPDNGAEIVDSVKAYAQSLAYSGTAHETLIAHEILGVDLSGVEHAYHMKNLAEIVIFAIITLPYIIYLFKIFIKLFKRSESFTELLKYLALAFGSFTMLPDFLIKVDYGRWILSVSTYYIVMLLLFNILDVKTRDVLNEQIEEIRKKGVWSLVLFIYPAILVPLYDVNIDQITAMIGHVINRDLLHWW